MVAWITVEKAKVLKSLLKKSKLFIDWDMIEEKI